MVNADGTVMHRQRIDLFGGGRHSITMEIRPILVRGIVLAGDEGLACDLALSNGKGGFVRVSADDDGRFETPLPVAGAWTPTVLYPRAPSPARVVAPVVRIPEEPPDEGVHELTIRLPGGRIHGVVESESGGTGEAVVHASRGGRLVAQQRTGSDGKFDLIGLAEGTYGLDAETAEGTTPGEVTLELKDDERREMKLVIAPYVRISGTVVTPDGRPASGATLKVSPDDGATWRDLVADAGGRFRYDVHREATRVHFIALTYDYPATFVTTAVQSEPVVVRIAANGGLIHFGRRRALLAARGVRLPTHVLHLPPPFGRFGGGVHVESGEYTLCTLAGTGCKQVVVTPGSRRAVELEEEP